MGVFTVLLFFIYCYGVGYSATFFLKQDQNPLERHAIRIGIGLGILPLLLVFMNLFRLPIDWKLLLIISLIIPLYKLVKQAKKGFKIPSFAFKKEYIHFSIVLVVVLFMAVIYIKGAFVYPYLEDDDPWAHATGVKYIALEKQIDDPQSQFFYIDPYPPGYDAIMGVLHQTNPSVQWTLKFFNGLIIALGLLFFYLFAKNFIGHKTKAVVATIILAMIPSYLSHFIWAHTLVVSLLSVALYCLHKAEHEKNWNYPLLLVIGGICLTQPSQPLKFFVIFALFILARSLLTKKFLLRPTLFVIGGYLLSIVWWFNKWQNQVSGIHGNSEQAAVSSSFLSKIFLGIQKVLPFDSGTATRAYVARDYFVATPNTLFTAPVGIGMAVCLLALLAGILAIISYKKLPKRSWLLITILWFLFTFLGVNSVTFNLPIGLFAFRFWMLLAIPIALLASEGAWFLARFLKAFRVPILATLIVLLAFVWMTSGQHKVELNQRQWPPGVGWQTVGELQGYAWLKTNLPANTGVFAYSYDEYMIGMDMWSCMWCQEVIDFRKNLLYENATSLHGWLASQNYEYLMLDASLFPEFIKRFGENETNRIMPGRVQEIGAHPGFQAVFQADGALVLKVV